jgi:hypothetical protein
MNVSRFLAAVAWLALAVSASADDLKNIERTVAKEPAYQTKSPKYCLLVFGERAQARAWLVLDGDVLYVDRNGSGDLTEAGERVKGQRSPPGQGAEVRFEAGVLTAREGVPPNARLEVLLTGGLTFVYCHAEGRPWQRAVVDRTGNLQFADSPGAAPILHFNGPLTLAPRFDQPLDRGANPSDLDVMVGTPGLGTGTFVRFSNEAVAKEHHPIADVVFTGRNGKPIELNVDLDQRC